MEESQPFKAPSGSLIVRLKASSESISVTVARVMVVKMAVNVRETRKIAVGLAMKRNDSVGG